MSENQPTTKEWERLYATAARVKELRPWEWMMEDDVFGVRNPENEELGFISVMGAAGEHYAVALYPGVRALYAFLELEDQAREMTSQVSADRILEIPQLQASFEDREQLEKQDREVIKQLKLKFRGANNWPLFRAYAPGLFPWFLSSAEARFLACALEQLLDVAPRFRDDDSILFGEDDDDFLVRTPRNEDGRLSWDDQIVNLPPPPAESIKPAPVAAPQLEALKKLPHSDRVSEIELTMLPMPVSEKKGRPFFPYLLLIVDAGSGAVLSVDLLEPAPSLNEMRAGLPLKVAPHLAQLGSLPRAIAVRTEVTANLLAPLAAELGIKLRISPQLPSLDEALSSMMQMGRGLF